jgi:hypothetical protein
MDKSKQQFEEFALSAAGGLGPGHLTKDVDGDYTNYAAQAYFDFWNGSRAALVIELPRVYTEATRKVIEAAGVKVAP